MRVVAGQAKGTRLIAPKGLDVRPTLDRVREALFSIIGERVEGAHFLDLYAGTGANGIEALSRGAACCTFVDNDTRSLGVIRRNLEATHLTDSAQVLRLTLPQGVATLARESHAAGQGVATPCQRLKYNIIFADPPYDFQDHSGLLEPIQSSKLLAVNGLIIIEHASRASLPDEIAGFHRTRQAVYGDTALSFFS